MKRWLVTLLLAVVALSAWGTAQSNKWEANWKAVDEAVNKGLPKTAIELINPIIEAAVREKAYPEAIKAIGRKIALEGAIQGNKPEEKITRLEAEIAKAPAEMKPVMEAILANWYWQYFQHNRWRFMNRTATAVPPGKDFTTWDLPRLFAEIGRHYATALSAAELKQTAVARYDDLLVKGELPDAYRPTLYDFVAHEALAFYNSGEQAAAQPEDAFELSADSPIFAPAAEFLAWNLQSGDAESPVVKAIRLYQDLLRFHQGDADQAAFLDDDLARLTFGYNKALGEEKAARFKAALKRYVARFGDHEISARARYEWANVLNQENEPAEARSLAQQGAAAFPQSPGGKLCYNLIQQIEAKSVNFSFERVWNQPWPAIQIRYRNITRLYFRAIPKDWLAAHQGMYWGGGVNWMDDGQRNALLAAKPEKQWSIALPATDDFRERTEQATVPNDIKPGYYWLLSSVREDFDADFRHMNNAVSIGEFWVSRLALVTRGDRGNGRLEGFVLDADSGEPIEGAQVQAYTRQWNGGNTLVEGDKGQTDRNGLYSVPKVAQRSQVLLATYHDQQIATENDVWAYWGNPNRPPWDNTVFFTDRSLYRPGQTIQYKGIALHVDQGADNYKVLAGEPLVVIFADANGKEIERRAHRTNDYGSFSGSFTAPRDRLTGRMSIRVEGRPQGATNVNVEEYKRPKFQATLDAPQAGVKLNGKVELSGKATAYTGAAVGGAKVRYRVVRQVRYPDWWGWCFWWRAPRGTSQEIVHGTAKTTADGSFPIEFTAKPDLSVEEKDEPIFEFSVSADVTDTSGETRSAQRIVHVGYTALRASLAAPEWLEGGKPFEIKLTTQTLDDEGRKAEGSLAIYRLKQPDKVQRPSFFSSEPKPAFVTRGGKTVRTETPNPDPANPNSWELGQQVVEEGLTSDSAGKAAYSATLAAGAYRAKFQTQDRFGKKVVAWLPLMVLSPEAKTFPIKIPSLVAAPKWSLEPGEEFMALWGTGYQQGRAYLEIEHRQQIVKSFWTEPGATQQSVKQAVTEAMRGGFTLHVTMVRENRAYLTSRKVEVPWTNKKLTLKWEHFVSKLEPGQKETWKAVITGPGVKKAVAEMVAALYDQSLDAYLPHSWMENFNVFREDGSQLRSQFENGARGAGCVATFWRLDQKPVQLTYRSLPASITADLWGWGNRQFRGRGELRSAMPADRAGAMERDGMAADEQVAEGASLRRMATKAEFADAQAMAKQGALGAGGGPGAPPAPTGPDLSQVSARKNLNETAFFFPHLVSDEDGKVTLEFTMPEALTQWKFLGFAHDGQLRGGYLEDKVVTAKDLMVQPNPPRFLREGDVLEFTVKVSNQSATRQTGKVRLTLANARTGQAVDRYLGNTEPEQGFELPAKESESFSWRLTVPDNAGPLAYKAVGSTGRISDGEEGFLPVLSRRTLVTESLPLPIRGPQTKTFDFTRLSQSGHSTTLRHQSLTVQMVSNPSWYAVMALPYLMESPYECIEQTFNRLYANSLARHIANADPKIHRVFEQWRATPALQSPLEKNQDLKSVLLEETPWVRQAQAESQARRNVGILFDDNRLNDETSRLLAKLAQQQLGDGAWPWFPGGPPCDYITLYITTGFGRLRHLGVKIDQAPAVRSLARLDGWIDRTYHEILDAERQAKVLQGDAYKEGSHLSPTIALYLYGRSFFLEDKPIAAAQKEAVDFFLAQARKFWLPLADRQSQGQLAIALKRFGDQTVPQDIMRSIRERSVSDEELGMFWRDTELSWWWYRAPIETQALMIEAFDEVMNDAKAVEDCKVWLLKQKQTQDWKTTKATADAVYALLLRGAGQLASDELVEVSLGGKVIEPEKVEAGTGFCEQRFLRSEITPQMGRITLKKTDPGVAWGSVHWQYLEDMSKVTSYAGTPLKLTKSLFIRQYTKKGPVLEPVAGPLKVGDELVVRITLRTDRDMEYVHLKDHRGSGTEPVNVLSQYRYQDGLGYYEATKDTASHFFIDYLPKGVYVFEYATRVVHKGKYQTGFASIQCMYAPEFNGHSESLLLEVR
jgi:hypothetical protein